MKMLLLIKCSDDGDSYETFSDLKDAKKVFNEEKKGGWYNNLVLCEIGPDQTFGFEQYGFDETGGANVICEWSAEYEDQ